MNLMQTIRGRTARAALALAAALTLLGGGAAVLAAPRTVDGDVEFTYYAPGAGKVALAGDFNGWSADKNPAVDDGKGNWSVTLKLAPGKHTYKFVVDGGWFADPENGVSEPDPYGGANSVVNVGADGKLVEAAAARPLSNTPLNAKVFVGGRYLTRLEAVKDYNGDTRFRLHRPSQQVDLNFHTTISDVVEAYTRLRLDNERNIVLNNVSAYLDEAKLDVHPGALHAVGYRNTELFTLGDPLKSGGDLDLPGTILDDHLDAGKGTAGLTVEADPFGCHFQGWFADAYDADPSNDPDLYDDTGRDFFALRLSRRVGGFEFGLPAYLERGLNWLDFNTAISDTSLIPALTRWRLASGDQSTWYEFEDHLYRFGVDARRRLPGDRGTLAVELLFNDRRQALVTGNLAGLNSTNGSLDVPLLSRTQRVAHATLDLDLGRQHHLVVRHTTNWERGARGDDTQLVPFFLPMATANKQFGFALFDAPATGTTHYSEATWTHEAKDRSHLVWLEHAAVTADFAAAGGHAPYDSTAGSAKATVWRLSSRHTLGKVSGRWGRGELETAFTFPRDLAGRVVGQTWEAILGGERHLARSLSALVNVRVISYNLSVPGATAADPGSMQRGAFWAPYGGLRYQPNPRVELVAAWGVDPLDFDIDYQGRRIGRWRFRQEFLWDNPTASALDAERHLADARVIGLRGQFTF